MLFSQILIHPNFNLSKVQLYRLRVGILQNCFYFVTLAILLVSVLSLKKYKKVGLVKRYKKEAKRRGIICHEIGSACTPWGFVYTIHMCIHCVYSVFYTETLWPKNVKCKLIHTGKVNLYNQTFHKTFFKMCDICGGIKYEVYKNLGHL